MRDGHRVDAHCHDMSPLFGRRAKCHRGCPPDQGKGFTTTAPFSPNEDKQTWVREEGCRSIHKPAEIILFKLIKFIFFFFISPLPGSRPKPLACSHSCRGLVKHNAVLPLRPSGGASKTNPAKSYVPDRGSVYRQSLYTHRAGGVRACSFACSLAKNVRSGQTPRTQQKPSS